MLKKFSGLILLMSLTLTIKAQKPLVWQILQMTTYQNDFSEESAKTVPNFPPLLVSNYEGEEVSISGYLIPVDVEAKKYALSKNPLASCFFCGGAGPETVIELNFNNEPGRFATDKYVAVNGVLRLNRSGYGLFYTLNQVEIKD